MYVSMFPPDRMIAHNLSPRCPDGSELGAYMDREWNATTAYLGGNDTGGGRRDGAKRPVGFFTRVARSTRSRVKVPFM
jgi:hypothetical protein